MTEQESRIKKREDLDSAIMEESLREMGSILNKEDEDGFTPISDPLFRACRLVGHAMNILFLYPADMPSHLEEDQKIKEICSYSKIKFRKVSLTKDWWKKDSLPLLGFYKDKPVALIEKKGGGYQIIDPSTQKKEHVNEKIASFLSQTAYSFYEPFPEGNLTGFVIFKFCIKRRLREILSILAIGAIGGLVSLIPPFFSKILFDDVILSYDNILLKQLITGFVVIAVASFVFMLTRSLVLLRLAQLVDIKMESAFWDRLLSLPANFFRQFTVGNLIQRLYTVSQIREELGGSAFKVILSGFFSLFYFFAMLAYSKTLAFIGLSVAFFALVVTAFCVVMKVILQRKILAFDGRVRGILVQLISGITKIRVGGAENRAFAYWEKPFFKILSLQIKAQKYENVVSTITIALPLVSSAVLFAAIIKMMPANQLMTISVGSIMAFLAAYIPFSRSIFEFCGTGISLIKILPLWERAKVIIQAKPETSLSKLRPGKLDGELQLDHIFFRYQKDSPLILEDVSIAARPGEFIAIVGSSGSGKSTLVRLLLGFEIPEKGCVYYSGKDLLELDHADVRKQIGSVLQNSSLFFGSIYENIVCGGIYTKEQLERAIRLSGLDEYLQELPMGLHTVVLSGGSGFSGGQIQKILISRALIANPAILIFDEATSALDNKTQELVSKNLEDLSITRIVIAHRLSTIQKANRIYVLDAGKIVQIGTFAALAEEEGLFKELLKRQSL